MVEPFGCFVLQDERILKNPYELQENFLKRINCVTRITCFTPVVGSIFVPLFQNHFSKRDFKNGHISRFTPFLIQVIFSGRFCSTEEIDLSFVSIKKKHPKISKPSFGKEAD